MVIESKFDCLLKSDLKKERSRGTPFVKKTADVYNSQKQILVERLSKNNYITI